MSNPHDVQFCQKTSNTDRWGEINGYDIVEDVSSDDGPRTRSMVQQPTDDWLVDTSAADVSIDDTRRLQIYQIEQLMASRENTKLLVLVKVSEVDLFGSDAPEIAAVHQAQDTGEMVI